MRSGQRRDYPRQLCRWPIGWALVALAAGAAGLAWLTLTLLQSLGPASSAPGAASSAADPASPAAALPSPPVRVCGNKAILGGGPSSPPKGAVVIPAGDNSDSVLAHNWTIKPQTTYWFAPGIHTLGTGQFGQIIPGDGDKFIGAPGAIL